MADGFATPLDWQKSGKKRGRKEEIDRNVCVWETGEQGSMGRWLWGKGCEKERVGMRG